MHRIQIRQCVHHHGVSRLVISRQPPLPLRDDPAVLLRPGDDLDDGLLQILHGDEGLAAPSRQQGRLVEEVLQIGAGKACGAAGDLLQIHVLRQWLVLGVYLQDLLPALDVRQPHIDLPVEPSRTQQRRVQNIHTVGGSQHHHALVGAEAVHLHQQLVQGLLPLVVSATQTAATLTAHGVDLVDENDGRGALLGLLEQIPHTGGAYATYISTKSEPEMDRNCTPASPATALASSVLPVPGGPTSSTPLGICAPQIQILLRLPEKLHDLPAAPPSPRRPRPHPET